MDTLLQQQPAPNSVIAAPQSTTSPSVSSSPPSLSSLLSPIIDGETPNESPNSLPSTPTGIPNLRTCTSSTPPKLVLSKSLSPKLSQAQEWKALGSSLSQINSAIDDRPGSLFKNIPTYLASAQNTSIPLPISFDFSTPHKLPGKRQCASRKRDAPEHQKRPASPLPPPSAANAPQHHMTSSSQVIKVEEKTSQLHQRKDLTTHVQSKTDPPSVERIDQEVVKTAIFSKTLSEIFPFDTLASLQIDPERCVSAKSNNPHKRCSKNAKSSMSAAVFARRVAEISSHDDVLQQLLGIEMLVKEILCTGGHHQDRACRRLELLRTYLKSQNVPTGSVKSPLALHSGDIAAIPFWLETLSSQTPVTEVNTSQTSCLLASGNAELGETRESKSKSLTVGAVTRLTRKFKVSSPTTSTVIFKHESTSRTQVRATPTRAPLHRWPQNFDHYRPNARLSTSQLIRKTLEKPLCKEDLKQGYVYIYWNPGNFGYVKVGFTTRSIEERLVEWRRQCGHGASEHVDQKTPAQWISHVRRVESLVLAELRDYRLEERGCPCGHKHREWVNVASAHVAKVRQKWTNFIMAKPRYEVRIGGRLLRDGLSEAEIEELCTPLEIEKVTPSPRRSERLRKKANKGR